MLEICMQLKRMPYNSIETFLSSHMQRCFVIVITNVDPGAEQMKHPEKGKVINKRC